MSGDRLSHSEVFALLSSPRRRDAIEFLRRVGGEANLRELVSFIAGRERGRSTARNVRKTVLISMLQTHIPRLKGDGLIEYNECNGDVRLIELPPDMRYHLEVVERGDIPWSTYYLILSVSGMLLSLLLGNSFAVLLAGCFVAAALIHTFQTYDVPRLVKHILTKYLRF